MTNEDISHRNRMEARQGRGRSDLEAHVVRTRRVAAYRARRAELQDGGCRGRDADAVLWEEFGFDWKEPGSDGGDGSGSKSGSGSAALRRLPRGLSRRAIEWVADHIELSDVKVSEAPTMSAWNYLKWARTNAATKAAFWNAVGPVLAKKIEFEREERFRDKGELASEIDAAILAGIADQERGVCPFCGRAMAEKAS